MKKIARALLLLPLFCAFSEATVLTVDNNPGAVAMYDNITDAYNAASDDDTILLAASATSYGSINCYKRLTFIGQGYWPDQNLIEGLSDLGAVLSITFKTDQFQGDSSGSVARSLSGKYWVDAGVTGIVIDKCHNGGLEWSFNGETVISRCYVYFSSGASSGRVWLNSENCSISNSVVYTLILNQINTTADHCIVTASIGTVPLSSVSNTIFTFSNSNAFSTNASYTHCMSIQATYLPEGGGNINGQLASNVFVDSGSFDGQYMLKEGSPAIGAGSGGTDMGIFGGATPYVLSGIPGIPRLTSFLVPATATDSSGLTFEVSAEAHPE